MQQDTSDTMGEPRPPQQPNGLASVLGGLCTFVVVMGIGRFAYTALLPDMMTAHGLDEATAGAMAAWNYAGYLIGVLAMRRETPGRRRYLRFVAFLFLSLVTTAGMGLSLTGQTQTILLWHGLRFLSGLASGACFVLCSAIVLDTLLAIHRPVLAGLLYSGVGCGIVLGGLAVGPLQAAGGPDCAWLGLAALCLLPAAVALVTLRPGVNRAPALHSSVRQASGDHPTAAVDSGARRQYGMLLACYFLEGFGYIIGTTFLVALVQATTQSPAVARTAWIVTGAAAAITAPLWRMAARKGYRPMLVLAFLLQGVGMLLPALLATPLAALAGGLLLGGTFMGIVVLSLQYGVVLNGRLSGKPSAHTVAIMTALYGVGQIIGPFVAGRTAQGQGFGLAFLLSGASLFLAAGLLLTGGRNR